MENKKQNKNNYQLYNFPLYIDLDEATENQYFIVDYAHLITGDLFKLSHVEIKPNVIHYWFIIDDFDDAENDPILETLDDYNINWILISPGTFMDLKLKPDPEEFGWKEVYRDTISVVYKRKTTEE